MRYPVVRFVEKPEVGATELFDFNDGHGFNADADTGPLAEGYTLGTPQIEGAPDGVGVEYGMRQMSFALRIKGSRFEALRVQAQLARQVLRPRNWLLFQLDESSAPVWFRTYNSQPGDLSFERVYVDRAGPDTWEIPITLWADPFALAERVTLPVATISNNPAAATNPVSLVLPEIIGDAPAPLRLAAVFSEAMNQHDIMWSLAPVPEDYPGPIVWQLGTSDGMTAAANVTTVTDAAFSGGSYRSVAFVGGDAATMATRLTGPAPAPVPPGRYKVLLRVSRSDTLSTFAFKLGTANVFGSSYDGSPTATMTRGTSAGARHAAWVDLGTHSYPDHLSDMDVAGINYTPGIALAVQRLTGTGAAELDCMILVPIDLQTVDGEARTLVSEFPGWGPQSMPEVHYWDGDVEAFARVNQFSVLDSNIQPINRGQYLRVLPGAKNLLHLLTQVRGAEGAFGTLENADKITTTTTLTASYHPRRLWIGEE